MSIRSVYDGVPCSICGELECPGAPRFKGVCTKKGASQGAADLLETLKGLCNESTCTRVEILGALEAVKLALYNAWTDG